MGPILLCDKAVVQSLHRASPDLLHHYFTINIPPILVIEVLGDLAKESEKDSQLFVRSLARKLSGFSAVPNLDFRVLVRSELDGNKVRMDYRPKVAAGRTIAADNGEVGIEVAEDQCEQALQRWRKGDFSLSEHLFSKAWRQHKTHLDWQVLIEQLSGLHSPALKAKTALPDVLDFVDDLMAVYPEFLTTWFCREFCIPSEADGSCKFRSQSYTAFCVRITLFALWAMKFKLVQSKSDNQLDLEYLFYLPFAHGFAVRDRFQRAIAPFFLTSDQMLVDYDSLADDLVRLAKWLDTLSEAEKQAELQRIGPPENEDSECHRLWKKFMRPDYRNRPQLKLTPEQEKRLLEHLRMLRSGKQVDGVAHEASDDGPDFIFRTRTINASDPCPCRSGRPYKDCHGKGTIPKADTP